MIYGVILAAGKGSRFGGEVPKQYVLIDGEPMWKKSVNIFKACNMIDKIYLIVDDVINFDVNDVMLIEGGRTRAESIHNAVMAMGNQDVFVITHDSARPFLTLKVLEDNIELVCRCGIVTVAVGVTDTVLNCYNNMIDCVLDRDKIYLAQTPQSFKLSLYWECYNRLNGDIDNYTDISGMFKAGGYDVAISEGDYQNKKITFKNDLC